MTAPSIFRALWFAGGLALLLGLARDAALELQPKPRELPRADGATGRPWIAGDFQPPRDFQVINDVLRLDALPRVSSYVDGDQSQGRAETAWFRPSRAVVHVGVAGYTQQPGIRLWAEFRTAEQKTIRIDCALPNAHEQWSDWAIPRPEGATAVRIIAEDRSAETFGWVAFTHPYRTWPGWVTAAYLHLQVVTTLALVLVLLWGPGLLWVPRDTPAELRALVFLAAGPLLLAAGGVLIWATSAWIAPGLLGFSLVAALWIALGVAGRRREFEVPLTAVAHRAFAVGALVVLAAAAKSTYSTGPEGETFRGTISRNLAVGDRIDSRFPFYIVQAAAQHLAPHAPATEKYFYPWTFFSRGPLAGLTAVPVVFATGGQPPAGFPDQRWSPFDREGFAAYRLTLITLAGAIIPAFFLLLAPLLGERWALIAAGLAALSPFGVHEVMFTWPKWVATAWLLTSFGLVHARRPGLAGLTLGVGFLYHPLVLLWSPWLALWALGRTTGVLANPTPENTPPPFSVPPTDWRQHLLVRLAATLTRLAAGAGVIVLPWMLLGQVMPHLPDTPFAGQGGFLTYWRLADSHLCEWPAWWHARWLNFANTFLPLHLVFSDVSFHHFRLNTAYGQSGPLVKFAFVWWNTLPFGLGLGLWALCLAGLARAWTSLRSALLVWVAGPALLMVLYWGMDPLGLLRECGHPLFLGLIAVVCATAELREGRLARVLTHRAVPWLQLPEVLLMLWLTTLLNPEKRAVLYPELDWLALTLNVTALLATALVLTRSRVER